MKVRYAELAINIFYVVVFVKYIRDLALLFFNEVIMQSLKQNIFHIDFFV